MGVSLVTQALTMRRKPLSYTPEYFANISYSMCFEPFSCMSLTLHWHFHVHTQTVRRKLDYASQTRIHTKQYTSTVMQGSV